MMRAPGKAAQARDLRKVTVRSRIICEVRGPAKKTGRVTPAAWGCGQVSFWALDLLGEEEKRRTPHTRSIFPAGVVGG